MIISRSLPLAGKSLIFVSFTKLSMLGEDLSRLAQGNCGKRLLMNFKSPAHAHLPVLPLEIITTNVCLLMRLNSCKSIILRL